MAARQQPQQKPLTGPIIIGTVVLSAVAIYAAAPGMLVAMIGVIIAAGTFPPAVFTGPKEKGTAYPTAAHAGEEAQMKRYRFWSDVKSEALTPAVVMPGWPIRLSWVYSLIAAAAAAVLLPTDGEKFVSTFKLTDMAELAIAITTWGPLANAVGALVLVGALSGASRRNAATGAAAPAVTLKHFQDFAKADTGKFVGLLLGGAIVGALIATVLAILAPVYQQWVEIPAWGWFLTVLPAGALSILGSKLTRDARAGWALMIAGNEEWKPRWENAKVVPAPRLVNRTMLGNIVIDEFEATPGTAVAYYVDLGLKGSLVVPDYMTFVLYRPKFNDQGQEVAQTHHTTRFQVVLWPEAEAPDPVDPQTDLDTLTLWVKCQLPVASFGGGLFPTYQLDRIEMISTPPAVRREVSSSIEGQVVAYVKKKDRVEPTAEPIEQDTPAIWKLVWWRPGGAADPRMFRERCVGSLSGSIGAQAAVDHRADGGNGAAYFGALWDMDALNPSLGIDPKMIPNILEEDDWTSKWANADSKLGVNPPLPQFDTKQTLALANGYPVHKMAFMCRQGVTPNTFFGMEEVLKTAMGGIPFVSITGFPDTGSRGGERHPLAFTMYWSEDIVPAKPELVRPTVTKTPGSRGAGGPDAAHWIIAAMVNQAFKAARLAQPEMISAEALSGQAPAMRMVSSNLWRIHLRLYGGVTLADVRGQTRRIQESLGTEWLRIVERSDGCTIVMGSHPRKLKLTDPTLRDYVENLNWQQAWEAAKVVGIGGTMPKLVSTRQYESNDQVNELIFEIPEGLSVQAFRDSREKLKSASGNGFIQVDAVAESARQVRLTVSEVDPMPVRAGYDWEYLKSAKGFPIGVGVTGEPIEFIPKEHIHFLVTGAAGSGKSVTMQTQVVAAIAHGFELYIADPTKGATDFSFAKPYSRAFCTTISDTAAMLEGVYKEVLRRVNLIKSTPGSANIYQLDEALGLRPIALVLDEFTSMIALHFIEKGDISDQDAIEEREMLINENAEKQKIGSYVAKIAREARSAGVALILGTQKLAAADLDKIPGGNTLKNNLSRSIAGKSSFGDRQSALREPTEAPEMGEVVPRGRLIFEPSTSKSVLVQGWYDPGEQAALTEFLEREGYSVLSEGEKMQLDMYRPSERTADPVVLELEVMNIDLDDLLAEDETMTVPADQSDEDASSFFGDLPGESFSFDEVDEAPGAGLAIPAAPISVGQQNFIGAVLPGEPFALDDAAADLTPESGPTEVTPANLVPQPPEDAELLPEETGAFFPIPTHAAPAAAPMFPPLPFGVSASTSPVAAMRTEEQAPPVGPSPAHAAVNPHPSKSGPLETPGPVPMFPAVPSPAEVTEAAASLDEPDTLSYPSENPAMIIEVPRITPVAPPGGRKRKTTAKPLPQSVLDQFDF